MSTRHQVGVEQADLAQGHVQEVLVLFADFQNYLECC
jgi:hypothetical protein